ncbi:MAG TPA: acetate--CoA ligase family protein, partial [Spirochaetales bacterium]|nr:acetate--CoA ligase family protein [Spirochaetales bacterium]
FDLATYPKGGISLLTQSGAFANSFLFWAESLRMAGLSKFASVGNMVDVSIPELLSFLKEDETTRVIGIYMEGVPDPRNFFEIARQVSPIKPIVVLKSGRSTIGSTAARSHTGALAGIDALYDGAFKQTGIIRAKSVLEFFDTLRALERQPLPEGNRVCIVTHMGGPGTICLDEVSSAGSLQPAKLSTQTCKALRSICSPMANIGSPDGYVDLSAAHTEKLHNQVLKILFQDDNVDLVLQLLAPSAFIDQKLLVKEITNAYTSQGKHKKPLFNAVTFGQFAHSTRRGLEKERIPTFEYPDMLARVAGNVATYTEFQRKARDIIEERRGIESYLPGKRMPAAELIGHALEEGRYNLLEPEAYRICEQYGIGFPSFRVESSFEGALNAAREIGYPVVLKVVDKEIIHKSAAGCVIAGICSDSSFQDAYYTLIGNAHQAVLDLKHPNILIQKMIPSTMELALGALREKSFGPIVMVGLGGIHIEALKLVGFRLAPLCVSEAKDFIFQTIPFNLTVESIAKTLVSLGRMLEELPQIEEVDLNPTLLYQNGCMAVDARIILSTGCASIDPNRYFPGL